MASVEVHEERKGAEQSDDNLNNSFIGNNDQNYELDYFAASIFYEDKLIGETKLMKINPKKIISNVKIDELKNVEIEEIEELKNEENKDSKYVEIEQSKLIYKLKKNQKDRIKIMFWITLCNSNFSQFLQSFAGWIRAVLEIIDPPSFKYRDDQFAIFLICDGLENDISKDIQKIDNTENNKEESEKDKKENLENEFLNKMNKYNLFSLTKLKNYWCKDYKDK